MNIPETILYAHDDSPIPEEAKQDDFYISAEKYNPQVLYCTIFCTVLYCTVQPAADAAHGAAARGGEVRAQHAAQLRPAAPRRTRRAEARAAAGRGGEHQH